MIEESGAVEIVRPTLRDGVDAAPGEPTLAHVEGGDQNLVLRNGLERDRLRVYLTPWLPVGGAQVEEIVVDGTVDLDVVEAVVLPGHGKAGHLGRRLHEIREVAGQRWEPRDEAL